MDLSNIVDVLTIVGIPFAAYVGYTKLELTRHRLFQGKFESLIDLSDKETLSNASSLQIQMAFRSAFGAAIESDQVKIALSRKDPLLLLESLALADRRKIKSNLQEAKFDDVRKQPRLRLKKRAQIIYCISTAPLVVAATLALFDSRWIPQSALPIIFGATLLVVFTLIWLLRSLMARDYLLTQMDTHPLLYLPKQQVNICSDRYSAAPDLGVTPGVHATTRAQESTI